LIEPFYYEKVVLEQNSYLNLEGFFYHENGKMTNKILICTSKFLTWKLQKNT